MATPADPEYPFQCEAVTRSGIVVRTKNIGLSDVMRVGRPIQQLRIYERGSSIPFAIPLPTGAVPLIYNSYTVSVANGPGGRGGSVSYCFGWEKEINGKKVVSVWEFSTPGKPPVNRDCV